MLTLSIVVSLMLSRKRTLSSLSRATFVLTSKKAIVIFYEPEVKIQQILLVCELTQTSNMISLEDCIFLISPHVGNQSL